MTGLARFVFIVGRTLCRYCHLVHSRGYGERVPWMTLRPRLSLRSPGGLVTPISVDKSVVSLLIRDDYLCIHAYQLGRIRSIHSCVASGVSRRCGPTIICQKTLSRSLPTCPAEASRKCDGLFFFIILLLFFLLCLSLPIFPYTFRPPILS